MSGRRFEADADDDDGKVDEEDEVDGRCSDAEDFEACKDVDGRAGNGSDNEDVDDDWFGMEERKDSNDAEEVEEDIRWIEGDSRICDEFD